MSPAKKNQKSREKKNQQKSTSQKTEKQGDKKKKKEHKDFYIVALGASAGGLRSLERFFNNMTPTSGIAFVVVTHMEPDHHSMMPELIQRETDMPVMQVEDGMKVEPNHIYIIPPDHDMGIMHGTLHLLERGKKTGQQATINYFLRALAEDFQEKAIAIILSGTGTDGSLGIKDVKERLGMVMAESSESAQYRGMPESAIETEMVDYVLPVEKMPGKLLAYIHHDKSRRGKKKIEKTEEINEPLHKIFFLLRNKTGHDFSHYKRNTITRRIERRMNLHQIDTIQNYIRYLQQNDHEIELLFKELIIGVTNFFRENKAFEIMKEKVFPMIFDEKPPDYGCRIWIPGTATGEEAYSVAIILHEYMKEKQKNFRVQIFATDIDEDAIEKARLGQYPASISNDISPDRLKIYFEQINNTYQVCREIREMMVFAPQNIIKDPPFTKLDLICCRNLLIYLDNELQQKILPLFHYSLKNHGILFLGSSETVGQYNDLFSTIDSKWKIYQKKNSIETRHPIIEFPLTARHQRSEEHQSQGKPGPGIGDLTEKKLLKEYAPPSVVINRNGDIIYVYGRTGKYLEPAEGAANWNIIEMAREGLKYQIPSLIRKAFSRNEEVRRREVPIKTNGEIQLTDVSVRPIKDFKETAGLMLVTFEDVKVSAEKEISHIPKEEQSKESYQQLEQELKNTKENLQTTIEELETSNEELKSMNEEYQSTNEELKSANEELETSREELQTLNEELSTVNAELEDKVTNLKETYEEMQDLLNSLDLPTLFLDNELCLKRYTAQVTNLIKLIENDIGRPIHHIATHFKDDSLVEDAEKVKASLQTIEKEVQTREDHWYLRRIVPYQTAKQKINGVVITFWDIQRRKRAEENLAQMKVHKEYAETIVETIREPILVLNGDMTVLSTNSAFYQTFHTKEAETVGQSLYNLGNQRWDIPRLRELLEEVLPKRKSIDNFEVEHEFPQIGHRKILVNARRMVLEEENEEKILMAFWDVTE